MVKLVRESISFERTGNVKTSLGLGYAAKVQEFFRKYEIPDRSYTITKTGEIIFHGDLYLSYIKDEGLFDNLTIEGYLDLSGSRIEKLPNNLKIESFLDLSYTDITKLPDDIEIGGNIYIHHNQYDLIKFINNSRFKTKLHTD